MFDVPTDILKEVSPLLGPIVNIIIGLRGASKEKRQQTSAATRAILDAVDSTEGYLQYQKETGGRMEDKEKKLVELWRTAGFELSQVAKTPEEQNLASRLRLKATAWEYQEQWPQSRIDEAKIEFETVKNELEKLKKLPHVDSVTDNASGFLE